MPDKPETNPTPAVDVPKSSTPEPQAAEKSTASPAPSAKKAPPAPVPPPDLIHVRFREDYKILLASGKTTFHAGKVINDADYDLHRFYRGGAKLDVIDDHGTVICDYADIV